MTACVECNLHWYGDYESAKCVSAEHQHRDFDVHVHHSAITLPDGTSVTGVSFDFADPYSRSRPPDFGLYFDRQWAPPWSHDHFPWPDFGVPDDPDAFISALHAALGLARAGQLVEIGCLGGHGRTGTALACLAVLTGTARDDAVEWVHVSYCADAVETREQEDFIQRLGL